MLAHGTHNIFILSPYFHSCNFSETFTFKSEFVNGGCALEEFQKLVKNLSSAFELCNLLARIVVQESTKNRVIF